MALVEIEDLNLYIPGDGQRKLVLRGLNWSLEPLEHTFICGENGAGKSTFLRLLHGELVPAGGQIRWQPAATTETSRLVALETSALVSPAAQEYCQRMAWPVTAADILAGGCLNMHYAAHAWRLLPEAERQAIKSLLADLDSAHLLDQPLAALSQGQLRLTLIARALLQKPALVLLDEVADGLDSEHREKIYNLLKSCSETTTMVFTGHRAQLAPAWIERVQLLQDGRLENSALPANQASPEPITRKAPCRDAPTLVEIENADVYVGRTRVLRNLTWRIRAGECWRLSGPNGSGKSTLLRLIAGDEFAAFGGKIQRRDASSGQWATSLPSVRKNIHLVSDYVQATYGYACTALELLCSGFSNTVGLYEAIPEPWKERAMEMLTSLLPASGEIIAQTSIRRLSTGQLRLLYLARALIAKPALLLLDEPFTGLDEINRQACLDLLAAEIGRDESSPAVVIVSHYYEDVPDWITRFARLEQGRLEILHSCQDA